MEDKIQKEESRLKRFNQRLRDFIIPGAKLSPQEEIIMSIIYKILDAPGTVKLTPKDGAYYLLNEKMHYFVKIWGNRLYIINSVDSKVRDCAATFIDYVYNAVDRSLAADLEKYDAMMFVNESKVLEKIEAKINENG